MSRNSRRPHQVGKRAYVNVRHKKPTRNEVISALSRHYKRTLIERGVIQDPRTRPPRYKFSWTYGSLNGVVYADDRSLARSLIKRDLGIAKKKRLPAEVEIVRELNTPPESESDEAEEHDPETCEVTA